MDGSDQFGFGRHQGQTLVLAVVLLVCILCASVGSVPPIYVASAAQNPAAAVVIEAQTGRVLYAQNAHVAMPMASTTKVLTAITVLQHLSLDRVVTIDPAAQGVEGSSVYLRAGERWTVRDLLYGLLLRSGNDCAVQLALSTAGSVEAFAVLLNQTAQDAGAMHSHFVNPHGLHHEDHYTTAYDLACITAYAMRDPTFRTIVATKTYRFTHCSGEVRVFVNKNKMLSAYPGANGVKTGYTRVAGRCLVSSAMRQGMQLVCVVLSEPAMWQRSAALMDAAFDAYRMRCLWQAGQTFVAAGQQGPMPSCVHTTALYPLTDAEARRLSYRYVRDDPVTGSSGTLQASLDGHVLASAPIFPSS